MRAHIEDIYELSPLQAGMLFHCLYAPDTALYFEQVTLTLTTPLSASAFDRAWTELVARHPILRTSFHWDGLEKPLQVVHREAAPEIRHLDVSALPAGTRAARIEEFLRADRARGMDLAAAPLLRVAALRTAPAEYHLVLSFHHILLDGWSMPLLFRDFSELYDAYRSGRVAGLEHRRPFGDYIGWLQQQDLQQAERFWRDMLAGYAGPPPLRLDRGETDAPAPAHEFADECLAVSDQTGAALQEFARRHQVTLNTVLQTAWALLLSRYSGERDIVFGAIVSGRPPELVGVESMIGMFINTIPVRLRIAADDSALGCFRRLQAQQFAARQYEYTPLVDVHGWSEVPRGGPLFETILVFENYPMGERNGRPAARAAVSNVRAIERTNYPLCLIVGRAPDLQFRLLYDARRFDAGSVQRMLGRLATVLDAMVADPECPVLGLSLLTDRERTRILERSRGTRRSVPACTIHDAFSAQAGRTPRAPAVIFGERSMSFSDLERRSAQLARHLRSKGIGPESCVGVALERSMDLPTALLGVLKTGAAYLPLDPAYPRERLDFMLADAGSAAVVTREGLLARLSTGDRPVVCMDRDAREMAGLPAAPLGATASPEMLAYVMYTSGSTGRPKGVMSEHRASMNRFAWMWREFPFAPGERAAVKTTLSFVDSVWEIFGPLLKGVPLVLLTEEDARDAARLVERLAHHTVTRIVLVPSLLRELLKAHADIASRLPSLGLWTSSGEALDPELVELFHARLPDRTLLNLYGSSEIAADATAFRCMAGSRSRSVAIGRPIDNTCAYVLDEQLALVPEGIPGDLYIGGLNLARGYVGNPISTAERFIADPYSERGGDRLYRTGDLARFGPDGNLEFVGRADAQVKLRGFRVEPGEIESALAQHPAIAQAVVAPYRAEGGAEFLTAYVVLSGEDDASPGELRAFLEQRLPDYMIPAAWVRLEALPLTPSGKILRSALPPPGRWGRAEAQAVVAPRTPTETELVGIWRTLLASETVGAHDNFFELGGHSLIATQLASRVRETFKVELPVRAVFESPTVAALAAVVDDLAAARPEASAPEMVPVARVTGAGRSGGRP